VGGADSAELCGNDGSACLSSRLLLAKFPSMGIAGYVSVCVLLYCMLVSTVFHYMFLSTWPSSGV
jgi:hypothetical protein